MNALDDAYQEIRKMEKLEGNVPDSVIIDHGLAWFEMVDVDVGQMFDLIMETLPEIFLAAIAEGEPGKAPMAAAAVWFKVGVTYGMDRGHDGNH